MIGFLILVYLLGSLMGYLIGFKAGYQYCGREIDKFLKSLKESVIDRQEHPKGT